MKIFKRKNLKLTRILLGLLGLAIVLLPAIFIGAAPIEASAATGTTTATISDKNLTGTHSSGTYTAYIGADVTSIGRAGFTVTGGTVNLIISDSNLTIYGPITVRGGTLNISFAYDSSTDTAPKKGQIKRHVHTTGLRNEDGYVPMNAHNGGGVTQYSGPLFVVEGGTLNVLGGALDNNGKEVKSSEPLTINGAGQFGTHWTGSIANGFKDDGSHLAFPCTYNLGTADTVEADGPLIYINDTTGSSKINLKNVLLGYNYNNAQEAYKAEYTYIKKEDGTTTLIAGNSVGKQGGALYIGGKSPTVSLLGTEIVMCYSANDGGAMVIDTTAGGSVNMSTFTDKKGSSVNPKVWDCYTNSVDDSSAGSNITATSTSKATVSFSNTTFTYNFARGSAGVAEWASTSVGTALSLSNCTVQHNSSINNAGAFLFANKANVTDTSFNSNASVSSYGGAIRIEGTTCAITDSEINNNTSGGYGGAIYASSSTLTLTGTTISSNTSSTSGGGVYASATKVTMSSGTISSNSANTAGGMYVIGSAGSFIMSGGSIDGNHATNGNGGGLFMSNAPFTMSGSATISNNTASSLGGAIRSYKGNITINGGTISGNTATTIGGGLYVEAADFKMTAGKITGNSTTKNVGGGVAVYTSDSGVATFEMSGGEISSNTGHGWAGGGVFLENANATISGDALITLNTANGTGGGGIHIRGAKLTMSGGRIYKNTAIGTGYGGGVYLHTSDFEMTAGTIEGNEAKYGGGVFFDEGTGKTVTISGTAKIISNKSSYDGGGIYAEYGATTVSGGEISSNTADSNGGGICVNSGAFTLSGEGKISSNKAPNHNGGGIYSYRGVININGGEISGNSTKYSGGGVYVISNTFTMTAGTISGNTSTDGSGGGVHVHRRDGVAASFSMSGGTITANTAPKGKGAGIYSLCANCTMSGGTISNNIAKLDGGAMYIESDGTNGSLSMTAGTISGNKSTEDSGGGIYSYCADVTINVANGKTCLLQNNQANDNGGAIYVNCADLSLTGTTSNLIISGNTVVGHGGAIYVYADSASGNASFTMNGGKISDNHATNADKTDNGGSKGGAVHMFYCTFTMNNGEISGNTAGREGGAIFVGGNGTYGKFILVNGILSNNSTPKEKNGYGGGAVCLWEGDIEMRGGTMQGNFANGSGGAVSVSYGDFQMSGGTISGNIANIYGGGIYIVGGEFAMSGTSQINDNYAVQYGGAVFVETGKNGNTVYEATFTMNGGTISGNGDTAQGVVTTSRGGAVYLHGSDFTMNAGTVSGNSATYYGGAVFITNKTISSVVYTGDFEMTGGTITANKTTTLREGKGGAFYLNHGNFTMSGGTISANIAAREGGAGYISTGDFNMSGGTIENNYTEYIGGGALYIWFGSFSMDDGCILRGNHAPTAGGAVYLSFGDFTMNGGELSGNYAGTQGGAVYLRAGEFIMNDGEIINNYTTAATGDSYGGGVSVSKSSLEESSEAIEGGTIHYWKHDYVAKFTMNGGTISGNGKDGSGNVLTRKGGGVAVLGVDFEMNGGTISKNYAKEYAGAVYVSYQGVTTEHKEDVEGKEIAGSKVMFTYYGNFIMNDIPDDDIDSVIEENVAYNDGSYGGAVYVVGNGLTGNDAKGYFEMTGGTIQYNGKVVTRDGNGDITAEEIKTKCGGAVYVNLGNFIMSGGSLINNAATQYGGAVYVNDGSFTMSSGDVSYNVSGYQAGAVAVFGTVTKNGSTVTGVTKLAYFTMTGGSITYNRAHGYSGAVHVYAGTFNMSAGDISNNIARVEDGEQRAARGGGVGVWYGTFTMSGGTISNNVAESPEGTFSGVGAYAGAVYVTGNSNYRSTFNMTGGTISGNHTMRAGGAVYVGSGDFSMSGGTISGNYTTLSFGGDGSATGWGGAVYIWTGNFTMSGGTLSGNGKNGNTLMTENGGAVYVYYGNFTMYNGTLLGNAAKQNGGAVYVFGNGSNKGAFLLTGGKLTQNYANGNGGAVFVESGSFDMRSDTRQDAPVYDIEISYNYALGDGGAVYVSRGNFTMNRGEITRNGMTFTVNGNAITQNEIVTDGGGAVYVYLGNFTMTSGDISYNNSKGNGGAIYVLGKDVDEVDPEPPAVPEDPEEPDIPDDPIGGEDIPDEPIDDGGDIDPLLLLNKRNPFGGVTITLLAEVVEETKGVFVMSGGTLSNNHSDNYGGAVYLLYGSFEMSGDAALLNNTSGRSGGAICINNASFHMINGTIQGNSAPNESGGGLYIPTGSFVMDNGLIDSNFCANNGGAICLNNGSFTMYNGTLSNNRATWGGAILLQGGNFTMYNGTLSGNYNTPKKDGTSGGKNGGAVFVRALNDVLSVFDFRGGTIENNGISNGTVVTNDGGAVYVEGGNFIMTDAADDGVSTIIRHNASLDQGGAVYVHKGDFTMNSGTITENGYIMIKDGEGEDVESVTTQYGGAVYVYLGNFNMKNGYITNNRADQYGGGVAISGNGKQANIEDQLGIFTMDGGEISGNKAMKNSAGGVRVASGMFIMNGGLITNNECVSASGGAIYLNDGTFQMNGGTITANNANNNGGAICMQRGDFIMNAGTLSNNTAQWGGAVHLAGGIFRMNGNEENCIISGNRATVKGGAVLVIINTHQDVTYTGKFEMHGGLITGNQCLGKLNSEGGGAVYVDRGNFEMYGGTITLNTSVVQAGAVFVDGGNFTMSGGTLIDNESSKNGGAVYVSEGDFTMSGGLITENVAALNGGAVYVSGGDFEMTSGTVSNNTAGEIGGGVYVHTGGSATIGVEGCYGDANLEGHTSCPIFTGNVAGYGGAIALYGSAPTFHCGSIISNTATYNGGGVYVKDANITLNYANIETNSAVTGAGIYVEAETRNVSVIVDSGIIRSNTCEVGGGIAVRAYGENVATVVIGRENCDGAPESEHKHPIITLNLANQEGGGLSLKSESASGILFTMYCGELTQNIANQNVPTGNVLQEGGTIIINGEYEIDNATVINGTYLRPDLDGSDTENPTVDIIYHYEITNLGQATDHKTTIITVGYGDSDLMKINLPSSLPFEAPNGAGTYILVRWERDNTDEAYECGEQYTLNSTTVGGEDTIVFRAVWILQGTGYAENPIVSPDDVYSHLDSGYGAVAVEIGDYFTVQFGVSECDPAKFAERFLSFNDLLKNGTTIIMIDITSGAKVFYYYTFTGEETKVSLSQFKKLGSPNETWSSTITDDSNKTVEEFLFIFDFTKTSDLYSGALQITLTRTYGSEDLAPIVQVGACSVVDREKPEASVPDGDYKVGDEFEITYTPGFIADHEKSIYYNNEVAYVFTSAAGIPTESHLVDEEGNKYYVNRSGSIIVPLGAAKETHTKTLTLVSPYLIGAGEGIELKVSVRATFDAEKPLSSPKIASMYITLAEKPIPAVDISVDNLIYYTDSLPDSVTVSVNTLNVDGYTLEWSTLKASGKLYEDTDLISVSEEGVLTFSGEITEGVYRIKLMVKDEFGNVVAEAVQNIAVLVRAVS